ncbi:hypothetical protein [Actinoplanes sp. GCM10030250]|uniref:hypothetical protein n=1 Tax=Actinoplanes sp. GCM10030250 TaxID=3273376 RepID=UPI003606EE67
MRYEMRMKPEFAREYTRERVVGAPFRYPMGGRSLSSGVVVGWADEPDGSVTLTVEQKAVEQKAVEQKAVEQKALEQKTAEQKEPGPAQAGP